jgi:hypothetical protein
MMIDLFSVLSLTTVVSLRASEVSVVSSERRYHTDTMKKQGEIGGSQRKERGEREHTCDQVLRSSLAVRSHFLRLLLNVKLPARGIRRNDLFIART